MLKLLNLYTVEFRQYQKKYYILRIAFSVAISSKYSGFNFILLLIFPSKHKALYKHNVLENAFLNKDLKTLHQQLCWNNWNVGINRFEQLRESPVSLKTINTLESFKSLWSYYIISWLL